MGENTEEHEFLVRVFGYGLNLPGDQNNSPTHFQPILSKIRIACSWTTQTVSINQENVKEVFKMLTGYEFGVKSGCWVAAPDRY